MHGKYDHRTHANGVRALLLVSIINNSNNLLLQQHREGGNLREPGMRDNETIGFINCHECNVHPST